jgi:excisionase family DNA binding protein
VLQNPVAARAIERFFTVREVAALLHVSTATVYSLCKSGRLEHIRVANAVRVPLAALRAFISRR